MVTAIKDIVQTDRHKIKKYMLYIKTRERGLNLSDNDLNVLALFTDTEDKEDVINQALEKKYVQSWQSGENVISRMVGFKLLTKVDIKKRKLDNTLLPLRPEDKIVAHLFIHNTDFRTGE